LASDREVLLGEVKLSALDRELVLAEITLLMQASFQSSASFQSQGATSRNLHSFPARNYCRGIDFDKAEFGREAKISDWREELRDFTLVDSISHSRYIHAQYALVVGRRSFSADKQGTPVQTRDGPAAVTER
jgi:hypothetical protein